MTISGVFLCARHAAASLDLLCVLVSYMLLACSGHLLFAGFIALLELLQCFVAVVCLSVEVLLTCRSARWQPQSW